MRKYLSNLAPREIGVVEAFTNDQVGSKLLTMGMRPGTSVEMIRFAPFKGCCYVKAGDCCLALRTNEAACILLEA
ncbi:MAG: ferrous iron transport protein A [Saprospiraceae bacterium]|nr:ferrous iron transport protein A [Saprospiraceae bacterium]